MTKEEYPYNFYPPYAAGGAYILSRSALHDLHYASYFTKWLLRIDDVYVGILARKVGITPIGVKEIHIDNVKLDYKGPESYRDVIASHGFGDPVELKRIFQEIENFNEKETKDGGTFIYPKG